MIKYTISTVNVQQLFVVIYDEKAFQWDQCNAWYWNFSHFPEMTEIKETLKEKFAWIPLS